MPGRRMGRFTKVLTLTPTVSASPDYTAKDNMGGKLSFTGAGRVGGTVENSGRIVSVVITDKSATAFIDIRIFFFTADPTSSTLTDNVAMDIDDADLSKLIGHVLVGDIGDKLVDNTAGAVFDLNIPFDLGAGTTLFAALMTDGAHNLASTSDITVRVGIEQD